MKYSASLGGQDMIDGTKDTYPKLPTNHWFALRKQFKKSVPPQPLTLSYVKSVLGNITEGSARTNVFGPLKAIGLLDSINKPTELAVRWRDDSQYANVCKEIREKIYPQEVRGLFPDADADNTDLRDWFANHTGLGENAASKMARFYLLLTKADLNTDNNASITRKIPTTSNAEASKPRMRNKSSMNDKLNQKLPTIDTPSDESKQGKNGSRKGIALHLDIQIHISPEASAEQIDKIFESMAKHLPLNE